jgi:hypothetical protein
MNVRDFLESTTFLSLHGAHNKKGAAGAAPFRGGLNQLIDD